MGGMRTLILLRHAQAENNNPMGDKARQLSPRGRQEAAEVGVQLRAKGVGHALVSSAARARETFECLGLDAPAEFMEALYLGGTETLRQRIGEVPDEVDVLLVVGHAPAIPSLSAELAYASAPREADQLQCWFPTAAYSEFTFEGSWDALEDEESMRLAGVRRLQEGQAGC